MAAVQRSERDVRRNILALDGGGVRGLSSLLILQDLMRHVNDSIEEQKPSTVTVGHVEPHNIFDFVAGTSTGGLIAIMLGKLGMTLDECIHAYHDLSKSVFGKKHARGSLTRGLAVTKYSGSHLRNCILGLIEKRNRQNDMPMFCDSEQDHIACAVICREHLDQSKYSSFKRDPVTICSVNCHRQVLCTVNEAARATSAAPTFFPVQKIAGRWFVDGGMEHNNPSYAFFYHITEYIRAKSRSRKAARNLEGPPTNSHHKELDFSRVRFINLGTGTKSDDLPPRQRDRFAQLVPSFIRMGVFLKRTLTEFAVNSENTAAHMASLDFVSTGSENISLEYDRFSADTGVCYIKMDEYKKLDEIESLTAEYLAKEEVKDQLKELADVLAEEYLLKQGPPLAPPSGGVSIAESVWGTPPQQDKQPQLPKTPQRGASEAGVEGPLPLTHETTGLSATAPSSTVPSTDISEHSGSTGVDFRTPDTELESSPTCKGRSQPNDEETLMGGPVEDGEHN